MTYVWVLIAFRTMTPLGGFDTYDLCQQAKAKAEAVYQEELMCLKQAAPGTVKVYK